VERGQLIQDPVTPVSVVVGDALGQDSLWIPATEDHPPSAAFTRNGPDDVFEEGMCSRSSHRGAVDAYGLSSEVLVEARGEPGRPVADEEPDEMDPFVQYHVQLLACWATGDQVERAVTPVRYTHRVPRSMKKGA